MEVTDRLFGRLLSYVAYPFSDEGEEGAQRRLSAEIETKYRPCAGCLHLTVGSERRMELGIVEFRATCKQPSGKRTLYCPDGFYGALDSANKLGRFPSASLTARIGVDDAMKQFGGPIANVINETPYKPPRPRDESQTIDEGAW